MLGHNTNVNQFRRTEIIGSMFSNHSRILEINKWKKFRKLTNKRKLNNAPLLLETFSEVLEVPPCYLSLPIRLRHFLTCVRSFFVTNKTFYLSPLKVWIFLTDSWTGLISISLFNFSTCLVLDSFPELLPSPMKPHEFSQFKLGILQYPYFSNNDIMEWISTLANLICVFSSTVWNQFIDHVFQVICL